MNQFLNEKFGDIIAPNGNMVKDNFSKWFGESKIIDSNGVPKEVFHGTCKDIQVFKNRFATDGWELFSDNPIYSSKFSIGDGGNILPAYLSIKNPLDLSLLPRERGDARIKLLKLLARKGLDTSNLSEILPYERDLFQIVNIAGIQTNFRSILVSHGFDGVIMPDIVDDVLGTTYIAFEPSQIKSSIGNSGNFCIQNDSLSDNLKYEKNLDFQRALSAARYVGDLSSSVKVALRP